MKVSTNTGKEARPFKGGKDQRQKEKRKEITQILEHAVGGKTGHKTVAKYQQKQRTLNPAQQQFFRRFAHRDAAILAWLLSVTDPFEAAISPIPASFAPGTSAGCPRAFPCIMKGFATANALGRFCIGLNADAWMSSPTAAAGSSPVPYNMYLGNSTSYGARGYPCHYTTTAWVGGAGANSDGRSYPVPSNSASSPPAGLAFLQIPNALIGGQGDCAAGTGNSIQRFTNVSAGLRCRPVTPASGAYELSGSIVGVQQILGDVVLTNPAAANSSLVVGGIDSYAYMTGMTGVSGVAASVNPMTRENVNLVEWDMAAWPKSGGKHDWLELAAIPNQTCSFGAWTPGNTGSVLVGYPQIAFLGIATVQGQIIEFEAQLNYIFYGAMSYEEMKTKSSSRVPAGSAADVLPALEAHMRSSLPNTGPRPAVAALAQTAVDSGHISAKDAGNWVKSGADAIEQFTGQSIGDLIGEGLGFLGAMLL